MSLILDALNKADQERSEQNDVPNLRAVHGSPYSQSQPGFLRRWRVELAFVAILLLGFISWQFLASGDSETAAAETPPSAVAATIEPEPAQPTAVEPPAPISTQPEVVAATPKVAQQGVSTPAQQIAPIEAVVAPAAVAQSGSEVDDVVTAEPASTAGLVAANQAEVKSLYARQRDAIAPAVDQVVTESGPDDLAPAVDPVEIKQEQLQKPQKAQNPRNPESELKARLAKLPMLSELSPQKQLSIPSIDFSLHVYSSEQGDGFVTLNGQRRRAGDQVAPGLRLEHIVDDFIVLNHGGTRFRLLSLNSWINLE